MGLICHSSGTAPDLSIVVISWRMRDLLERMLSTLVEHTTGIDYEVICIDNGSEDGTAEMVSSRFPDIRLIRNTENLGVAPARNQGLPLARGEFVAILDADLELVEDSLSHIVGFLRSRPSVGLAGCRLVFPDGTTQFNAKRFPSLWALVSRRIPQARMLDGGRALRWHEMHDWTRGEDREVDYLIGACQVFRRIILDQVGLLDDQIFYGPEDIDFCLRVRRAGWQIWWLSSVRIIHHEQRITRQKLFSRITYRHLLGLGYFFRKHGLRYADAFRNSPRDP